MEMQLLLERFISLSSFISLNEYIRSFWKSLENQLKLRSKYSRFFCSCSQYLTFLILLLFITRIFMEGMLVSTGTVSKQQLQRYNSSRDEQLFKSYGSLSSSGLKLRINFFNFFKPWNFIFVRSFNLLYSRSNSTKLLSFPMSLSMVFSSFRFIFRSYRFYSRQIGGEMLISLYPMSSCFRCKNLERSSLISF